MEHWFDRLAEPHTRRATLKGAAIGGAALLIPYGRATPALAVEQCTDPCRANSLIAWDKAYQACDSATGQTFRGIKPIFDKGSAAGVAEGYLRRFLEGQRKARCYASAELEGLRQVEKCQLPQCGDPGRYPGGVPIGKPPASGCTDPGYYLCGGECCDPAYSHCGGCVGAPVCCALGKTCCNTGQ